MKISDIDLAKESEAGAKMMLLHPSTDEPLSTESGDMYIILAGQDSKQFRKASNRINNRELRKRRNNRSIEKADENACELLAACTLDWLVQIDSEEPEKFSEEAARNLYRDHPWVREQVDLFVADRNNFLETA